MQQDRSRTGGRSCDFHFPLTGEMQPIPKYRETSPVRFHFPLTGEMQPRGPVWYRLEQLSFPAHGRDATLLMIIRILSFRLSFPAHGRDATRRGNLEPRAHVLSFPAHGRDATTDATPPSYSLLTFISRSRARCNIVATSAPSSAMRFHFPLTGEMQRWISIVKPIQVNFHFPLTGEMQRQYRSSCAPSLSFISRSRARCNGATFLPSNSACQEVHLREPAFAIFWNIDFSFRNRMFDVGSRQIA